MFETFITRTSLILIPLLLVALLASPQRASSEQDSEKQRFTKATQKDFPINQPATLDSLPSRMPDRIQVVPPPSSLPNETEHQPLDLGPVSKRFLPNIPHEAALYRNGVLYAQTYNANNVHRSASVSKLITAAAVFKLIDQNKLSLDTKVLDIFPNAHTSFSSVTIESLLSNKSGIPPERNRWFGGDFTSCEKTASIVLARNTRPSGQFQYSNTNFCLLSLVIGSITKKSYQESVFDLVYTPLNISSPVYDPDYTRLEGAGAWMISAVDIGKILVAIDPEQPSIELLSKSSSQKMVEQSSYNYAYGLWVWPNKSFGHSGTLNMARNIATRLPNKDVVVIMAQTNTFKSGLDLFPRAQSISSSI